mmetsp:Transcript_13449/g.33757  ORF Transcript_13449/g.33757 Transcript_13449/m.33757 type:complete len:242 (-) Transcript_13449:38-763(-)
MHTLPSKPLLKRDAPASWQAAASCAGDRAIRGGRVRIEVETRARPLLLRQQGCSRLASRRCSMTSSDHEIGLWLLLLLLLRRRGSMVEAVVILPDALPSVVPHPAFRAVEGVHHFLDTTLDARRPLGHPAHPALGDATLAHLHAPVLAHFHGLPCTLGCHTSRALGANNRVADVEVMARFVTHGPATAREVAWATRFTTRVKVAAARSTSNKGDARDQHGDHKQRLRHLEMLGDQLLCPHL